MKKQKGLALVLAALMVLGTLCAAAEEAAGSLMGSKKAAPTELTEDNRETTVTLSLPSEEYKNKVDVVFVMDKSTSAQYADFNSKVTQLLDSIVQNNTGIELKVGVIKFRGIAENMLGESDTALLEYTENKDAILSAINADMTKTSSGSNIHSGLVMCNKALEADAEVPDENKYVILLSDGKSYIWNNEDDVATTYYAQWTKHYAIQYSGCPVVSQGTGYDKEVATYHYRINNQPPLFFENASTPYHTNSKLYSSLFAVTDNDELLTTSGYYDTKALYAYGGTSSAKGTVTRKTIENPPAHSSSFNPILNYYYEYTPDTSAEEAENHWEDLHYLQSNPYKVEKRDDGKYYTVEENGTPVPNEHYWIYHPDCLQKGTYIAGHYWKEVIDAKYNTGAIVYRKKDAGETGYNVAYSFSHWLQENSDRSAYVTDAESVESLFNGIDNSIRYLVNSGTVTDQIKDDFTLKESDAPFTVTVSGKALAVTKTGDSSWVFGDPLPVEDGTVYPYEISYDAATKTITWTINVPVEIANPVTLSYDLILNKNAKPGTYDTNEYAILNYESTDGTEGEFTFPIPQVTYTKAKPTNPPAPPNNFRMYFYKEWPDGEPTDIFFTLYQPNGSVYKHAFKKTKVSDTKFLYEAWLSNDAEYFVIETAMAGYNTAYKNTGAHADVTDRCYKGGTIVNTKIPVTGDSMSYAWVLLALASIGALGLLIRKKRKQDAR